MRPSPGNDLILGKLPGRPMGLGLSRTERDKHLYVCGGTGTGKSKFLENLIRQDIRNWSKSKCGVLVLDPHGSLYDSLINWLAWTGYDRPIIPIDLRQDDWIVSYNLLRQRESADPAVLIDNLTDAMAYVWGQHEKLLRGEWPGQKPLGYVYDSRLRNIVPDPKKARIAQTIFEEYATGQHGLQSMAERFFELGVTTKRGDRVSKWMVHRVLTNRAYIGLMQWKGELYEGKFKPLISVELFDAVQKVLKRKSKARKVRNGHNFPFCGVFRCSCGSMVTAQWAKGRRGGLYRYYRCALSRGTICTEKYLQEKAVTGQCLGKLLPLALSAEDAQAVREIINEEAEKEAKSLEGIIKDIEKDMQPLQAKLDRLTHGYLDELIDEDTYRKAKEDIILQRAALKGEKERLRKCRSSAWIEPSLELINGLESMGKPEFPEALPEIAKQVLKVGLNPSISGKKVTFSLREPYDFVSSLLASAPIATLTMSASRREENPQSLKWCSGRDLNPHALRHTPLKRTCLPISPPEHLCGGRVFYPRRRGSASVLRGFVRKKERGALREGGA